MPAFSSALGMANAGPMPMTLAVDDKVSQMRNHVEHEQRTWYTDDGGCDKFTQDG